MNSFVYSIPTKVYFGENQLSNNLGTELKKLGQRVLLTYGGGSIKRSGLYDLVIKELQTAGLDVFELNGIDPNPRIETVRAGADLCKKENIDVLLAVGGGSTLDCTKHIAAAACVDFDPWLFFSERVPIEKALPVVTILTLAATGSEMNGGGVITNFATSDKIGRSDPKLLPQVSFLDPTLTYSVNEYQTACGSADILSHIMEVYFNINQDLQLLDGMMEAMMKTVIKYAPIAIKNPTNYEARANLMWTGSWAINGFINGGKRQAWSCHPMEHQLSAVYDITHGLGLAILTPRWMEYTLNENSMAKFYQFGVNVLNINPQLPQMEVAKQSISLIAEFFSTTLGLKSTLKEIDIDEANFASMAAKVCGASGILAGFQPLTPTDVVNIYRMCL